MKKLKVLQVNKLYYPVTGGIERVVQQLAEGLRDRVDMKVLVCQKKGPSVAEQINGVEVHRASSLGVALSMPLSLSFFSQFRRLSKESDVIHIHMPFPLADVAAFLSGYKGKIVLWWHCDVVRQKKLLLLYKPVMHWLLKRADRIMVATEGHINGSSFLPPFRDKCVVIPFGVDPFLLKKSEELAQIPMPPHEPLSILFVGRLVYYKGCEVLLDAFAKTHGAELKLVGDGVLKESLLQRANNLGITERVHFLGNIDEDALARAFADCDFFVLPSVERTEAFGLVQSEAMAYGKPVINTNLPTGVPYVSLDGQTGFTVEPGDIDALAEAMQRLIDDSALREKFARAAYRRAREDFSMVSMLDAVYAEYEKLMQ